ncbi:MAG TPA: PTS sugar transporter subunit IIA [bacterium]
MKSLLNALQEGRLVELPVNDKDKVLEYLAVLIEAIPDIGTGQDLVSEVKKREAAANTGIGMGVACPHVRSKWEGELLCSVGWSPEGIDYGAPDGKKVHLVIMYYIPDSQRNSYLKEVSGLAKAIHETDNLQSLFGLADLHSVRNRLLDWVDIVFDKAIPDAKARMIQLEERHAALMGPFETDLGKTKWSIIPFSLLVTDKPPCVVLAPNQELADTLESVPDLHRLIPGSRHLEIKGYLIAVLSNRPYSKNRTVYDCVAIRFQ